MKACSALLIFCLAGAAAAAHPPADARIDVAALVADAEAALRAGDTASARRLYERAAGLEHSTRVELGVVHTYLQAGFYRQALALAAHTAGAHPQDPAGAALYAWLLQIGGQPALAKRALERALERLPDEPMLSAVGEALKKQAPPGAAGTLGDVRFAPHALDAEPLPPHARTVSSGALVADGTRVLTSAAAIGGYTTIYVRTGLGRSNRVTGVRVLGESGVAELTLGDALRGADVARPASDPFPGSPGYAVSFTNAGDAQPQWPVLRAGFLGTAKSRGAYRAGIEMPPEAGGGPVFDIAGRLVGLAVADGTGEKTLVLASVLGQYLKEEPPAGAQRAPQMAPDAVYEQALTVAVQVIGVR